MDGRGDARIIDASLLRTLFTQDFLENIWRRRKRNKNIIMFSKTCYGIQKPSGLEMTQLSNNTCLKSNGIVHFQKICLD